MFRMFAQRQSDKARRQQEALTRKLANGPFFTGDEQPAGPQFEYVPRRGPDNGSKETMREYDDYG